MLAGAMRRRSRPPRRAPSPIPPVRPVVGERGRDPTAPPASGPWRGRARSVRPGARDARRAEPHRRVAVLDRSLHRAGRGHRRLLDVHYHHLLEDRWADETVSCAALLRAMGDESRRRPRCGRRRCASLAFAPKNPGSITSSLTVAWENARGAREAISSEMWEVLNTAHYTLGQPRSRTARPRTSSSAGCRTATRCSPGSPTRRSAATRAGRSSCSAATSSGST